MTNPTLWNQILIWPIVNVLAAFYKFFEWVHIPGPLGFAIILLTILIRLILYPFMNAQMKSAKKMAALKPHMDAIQAKHKDDKKKLQQAQMDLYKEHGINPAAGCLPLLIQMPVLIALYNVFYQVLGNGNLAKVVEEINQVVYAPWLRLTNFDLVFFGANLGVKPSEWQTQGWWLLSIPVITGLLQWWQTKLMMPQSQPAAVSPQPSAKDNQSLVIKKLNADSGKLKAEKEDMGAEMQKQMAMITPVMFGFFALQFPLGLSLYWNIFGLMGIIQQLAVNREK